jgi:hypothetical protein
MRAKSVVVLTAFIAQSAWWLDASCLLYQMKETNSNFASHGHSVRLGMFFPTSQALICVVFPRQRSPLYHAHPSSVVVSDGRMMFRD